MKKFVFALVLLVVITGCAWSEESTLPVSYDLREHNIVPTAIRDQGDYGLCWSFSAMGAIESNYMLGVSEDKNFAISALYEKSTDNPDNPHASELFMGWFLRKTEPGSEHLVFSVTSGDKRLLSMEELAQNPGKVLQGGHWYYIAAFLSRGFGWGPIPYSELLYPDKNNQNDDWLRSQIAAGNLTKPEHYNSVLWLTNIDYVSYPDSDDKNFEANRDAVIREVKKMLMENGAMVLTYTDVDNSRSSQYHTYYCSDTDTEKMRAENPKSVGGHAVTLIGWDDNFPAESFDLPYRQGPDIKGAWLIKNSWGTSRNDHDNGYFWMSYAQTVDFQSYNVEKADKNLACYEWDPLGFCTAWGEKGKDAYAVNVFKTGNQAVKLEKIGFYTNHYDTSVDVYVNTDYGTTKPTKDTVALGKAVLTDYRYYYIGYHMCSADVTIPANSYFSVAIRVDKTFEKPIAIEARLKGYSDYADVFDGQSFFSTDGENWTDGTNMLLANDDTGKIEVTPMNACIKAFVSNVNGGTVDPQPETPKEEQTINEKPLNARPENTVSDADLMNANNPSGENAAILTGRNLSLFLLDNDSKPLSAGTQATIKFLFLGTGNNYNSYFEDDDDDKDLGYSEKPGDEWLNEFYPDGYEPNDFVDDEGELYAAYVINVKVGANGNVTLSADAIPTATTGRSIPVGYYDVFYLASNDSVVGTLPIVEITSATPDPEPEPDPDPDPDPEPDPDPTPYIGGSSGGCDTGICGLALILFAGLVFTRKK